MVISSYLTINIELFIDTWKFWNIQVLLLILRLKNVIISFTYCEEKKRYWKFIVTIIFIIFFNLKFSIKFLKTHMTTKHLIVNSLYNFTKNLNCIQSLLCECYHIKM